MSNEQIDEGASELRRARSELEVRLREARSVKAKSALRLDLAALDNLMDELETYRDFRTENPVEVCSCESRQQNPARWKPPTKNADDGGEVEELVLYAETTGELYPQKKAILESQLRKMRRGVFDASLAPQAWMHFADAAAASYGREFPGARFSADVRRSAAERMAKVATDELRSGEHGRLDNPAGFAPAFEAGAGPRAENPVYPAIGPEETGRLRNPVKRPLKLMQWDGRPTKDANRGAK